MHAYDLIIAGSVAIILSYIFSEISRKTNIPSVLMLILTGILAGLAFHTIDRSLLAQPLEVLGTVGLIMIVLEGALDLELSKEKLPLIKRATGMALIGLVGSILVIGLAIFYVFDLSIWISLLYATPLSVISSAIVIPSVDPLDERNKEFLIYESCISDILGIMLFYFFIGMLDNPNKGEEIAKFSMNLVTTIVISTITSFGLIVLFKYIKSKVKIFLFLAILIVLYAIEKQLHLSPLILILLFGLMLKNNQLIFRGQFANLISKMELKLMERNFHIITRETSFVLRTFFFIIFGLSMVLKSLLDYRALLLSIVITGFIFLVRWLLLNLFDKKNIPSLIYIAPRGLITVLLYYSIPGKYESMAFPDSIILYVVIFTSIIMSVGLIKSGFTNAEPKKDLELEEGLSD
ncbi:MAG: cell volume regulation protein A [Bacteroidia bacterium]|jgi:cell volume regulation protein A